MTRANSEWEYNSLNLTKVAYNFLATGTPEVIPGKRGENLVVPHKTGRIHVAKFFDERHVVLSGYVKGSPVAGGAMTGSQLWANLDVLKKLFGDPGQHTLKHKSAAGDIRQAQAEVSRQVDFRGEGPDHYKFAVEFTFADPWWYAQSQTIIGPTVLTSSPQNVTCAQPGTYDVEKAQFTIFGQITNPKLTMDSIWVQYTGVVAVGATLVIDCGLYRATLNGVDVTGQISHDGSHLWLPIPPSLTNSLTVTGSALGVGGNAPQITVVFTAPYI